jgi:hypothetical protein
MNGAKACFSRTGEHGYQIPINTWRHIFTLSEKEKKEEWINMLTSKKNEGGYLGIRACEFTISEIEVWGVKFGK